MTSLIYFVAATEDGFIAGPEGELDWLHPYEKSEPGPAEDYGYADFLATIDGLVMGRSTFDVTRSFGDWPYGDRPTWVLTRRDRSTFDARFGTLPSTVRLSRDSPAALQAQWQASGLRRVWLVGGGELAAGFAAAGLIDELVLTTVPVRLGRGIGLFGAGPDALASFRTTGIHRYANGLVQRHAERIRLPAD